MTKRAAWTHVAVAAATLATATLTACAPANNDAPPMVVASTEVWASVAREIAGDDIDVKALTTSATADPHSFEPTAAQIASLSDAALVLINGGGYDAYAENATASRASGSTINAFDLRSQPADSNEHVFYDLDAVARVADRVADRLSPIKPELAQQFHRRADQFKTELTQLKQHIAAVRAAHPEVPILQTEPVAHYLLAVLGMRDQTPHDFTEAVESDNDPAPATLAATTALLDEHKVGLLVFNTQTESSSSVALVRAAQSAGVPVAEVSEVIPSDTDYVAWQRAAVNRLETAVGP